MTGLPRKAGIVELLNGGVKCIHVDVKDYAVRLPFMGTHYSEMGPNLSLPALKLDGTVGKRGRHTCVETETY